MWFVLRSLAIFTSSWSKILEPHFLTSAHYKLLHLTTNWEPRLPMSHRWSYLGEISCCWIIQLDGHVYQGLVSRDVKNPIAVDRYTVAHVPEHFYTARPELGPFTDLTARAWTHILQSEKKNLDPSVTRNAVFYTTKRMNGPPCAVGRSSAGFSWPEISRFFSAWLDPKNA
jgi:hypothetical protein